MLGHVASSHSLAAAPICQANKIPMISPSSTNPRVTQVGDYIFRVCFIDPFQGAVMAKFAHDTLKVQEGRDPRGRAERLHRRACQILQGGVPRPRRQDRLGAVLQRGRQDFKAQLTAHQGRQPGGDLRARLLHRGRADRASRRASSASRCRSSAATAGMPKLLEIGGEAVNGPLLLHSLLARRIATRSGKFVADYKARYNGKTPDAMAALRLRRRASILVDAMRRAGSTDGKAVRDAIAATRDFQGVTGHDHDQREPRCAASRR